MKYITSNYKVFCFCFNENLFHFLRGRNWIFTEQHLLRSQHIYNWAKRRSVLQVWTVAQSCVTLENPDSPRKNLAFGMLAIASVFLVWFSSLLEYLTVPYIIF